MCQCISIDDKALVAKGFPGGWRFAFHRLPYNNSDEVPYLVILAPNGVRYKSVEKAENHYWKSLATVDAAEFYEDVGIDTIAQSVCTEAHCDRVLEKQPTREYKRSDRLKPSVR